MKPNHIRVFDGLRITTGHVNHLQTAIRTSFEDLRNILGAGVQRGLAVTASGNGNEITIQPGLAFDANGNRIVCDDSITIPVAFASDETLKYVSLKYEQVEDGVVEGHPTLIFDSCSAAISAVPPEPEDNLVPLAKLVKTQTAFSVEPLEAPLADSAPAAAPEAHPFALRVAQGVLRLSGVRAELTAPAQAEVLGEQDLAVEFAASSITAHVLLSADVTLAAEAEAETPAQFRLECLAQGEASINEAAIQQFSISSCPSHQFSEGELARLFLTPPETAKLDALGNLYLALRLGRTDSGALRISSVLESNATLGSEAAQAVAVRKPSVSWRALFAWKALGVCAGK